MPAAQSLTGDSFLQAVLAVKRDEVSALAAHQADLEAAAKTAPTVRPFHEALRAGAPLGIIAEIKRASPSAAAFVNEFDPSAIAQRYQSYGADCLSVLTDARWFQGSTTIFKTVRACVSRPLLRKDFLIDPLQVIESRAIGADCILVILALVDDACAAELILTAKRWQMSALVEVHCLAELERACALGAELIGVNNRNLQTLTVDIATSEQLLPRIPKGVTAIAESGIQDHHHAKRMHAAGAHALLVGEALMRTPELLPALKTIDSV